jgi:anti-sigma factor (TIGR02949 family)
MDRYTCEEAFRRLNDYLDRELSAAEMKLVREHLEVCALCATEFAFEASVLREVRSKVEQIKAPTELLTRVNRAITESLGNGRE